MEAAGTLRRQEGTRELGGHAGDARGLSGATAHSLGERGRAGAGTRRGGRAAGSAAPRPPRGGCRSSALPPAPAARRGWRAARPAESCARVGAGARRVAAGRGTTCEAPSSGLTAVGFPSESRAYPPHLPHRSRPALPGGRGGGDPGGCARQLPAGAALRAGPVQGHGEGHRGGTAVEA